MHTTSLTPSLTFFRRRETSCPSQTHRRQLHNRANHTNLDCAHSVCKYMCREWLHAHALGPCSAPVKGHFAYDFAHALTHVLPQAGNFMPITSSQQLHNLLLCHIFAPISSLRVHWQSSRRRPFFLVWDFKVSNYGREYFCALPSCMCTRFSRQT